MSVFFKVTVQESEKETNNCVNDQPDSPAFAFGGHKFFLKDK